MKTLTLKTNLTKAALLGALAIAPALALTGSAQAAPAWNHNAPTGNNHRSDNQRDDRRGTNRPAQGQNYGGYGNNSGVYQNQPRYDTHDNGRHNDDRNNGRHNDDRNNGRHDDYRNDGRNYNYGNNGYVYGNGAYGNSGYYENNGRYYDRSRHDNNNSNTVVAGVLGAIIGSVLSH